MRRPDGGQFTDGSSCAPLSWVRLHDLTNYEDSIQSCCSLAPPTSSPTQMPTTAEWGEFDLMSYVPFTTKHVEGNDGSVGCGRFCRERGFASATGANYVEFEREHQPVMVAVYADATLHETTPRPVAKELSEKALEVKDMFNRGGEKPCCPGGEGEHQPVVMLACLLSIRSANIG